MRHKKKLIEARKREAKKHETKARVCVNAKKYTEKMCRAFIGDGSMMWN